MKKIFTGVIFLLFVISALPARQGHCETQTPEQLVRDFYTWYINMYDIPGVYTIDDDEIYKYVYTCTVKRLRMEHEMSIVDADYFLTGQDFDSKYLNNMLIRKAIKINDTVCIVPVSFGLENGMLSLIVFVQNENGILRITKVEDMF